MPDQARDHHHRRRPTKRDDQSPAPRTKTASRRFQEGDQHRFELLVRAAVDGLPAAFHDLLGDVPVIVEDQPTAEDLANTGTPPDETLLGMYQGVPLTGRLSGYGMALPERIVIYRIPIQEECVARREIIAEVQRTLVHELAHHYGIEEQRLAELGWE